jgi:hypothetical protein
MTGARVLLVLTALAAALPARADGPAGPSAVIYAPSSQPLRFSHRAHRSEGCASCHTYALKSTRAQDDLTPAEAVCARCHRIDRAHPERTKCARCHTAWNALGFPLPVVKRAPQLKFSHKLHAAIPCVRCHEGVEDCTRPSLSHLPTMTSCRECHEGKRRLRCSGCHLTDPSGRLRTRLDTGLLTPSGSLHGDRHGPDFVTEHGQVGKEARYCESCHRQAQCLHCHNGVYKPRSIHGNNYALLHGPDARRNKPDCGSCHRGQSFCVPCHERSGVSPAAPDNPFQPGLGGIGSGRLRFHPSGWSGRTAAAGNLHAAQARRNMRTCSSCHREDACLTCHTAIPGRPANISPHGPGFATSAKCRSLARNKRVCHKCHDPSNTPSCR